MLQRSLKMMACGWWALQKRLLGSLPQVLAKVTNRLPVYFDKSEVLSSKNRHIYPNSHAYGKYNFNKTAVWTLGLLVHYHFGLSRNTYLLHIQLSVPKFNFPLQKKLSEECAYPFLESFPMRAFLALRNLPLFYAHSCKLHLQLQVFKKINFFLL